LVESGDTGVVLVVPALLIRLATVVMSSVPTIKVKENQMGISPNKWGPVGQVVAVQGLEYELDPDGGQDDRQPDRQVDELAE
jgi:hypothetical protein